MRQPLIIAVLLLVAGAAAAQTPQREEPGPRQPRAAVPGPNAEPGIPQGETSKTPDFSVNEHMPQLSTDQVAAVGAKLRSENGDTLGTIENVVLDRNGQVVALVVGIDKLLGLTEEHIEIDWKQVRFERRDAVAGFVTSLSKEELRGLARFTEPKRRPS
jgi:hypothetical protein